MVIYSDYYLYMEATNNGGDKDMEMVRSATKKETDTAAEKGKPAEKRVMGILRGGYNYRGDFYYIGRARMVSKGIGKAHK